MKYMLLSIALSGSMIASGTADETSEVLEVVHPEKARQHPAFHIQGEYIQVYDSLIRDPSPGICGGIYFTKAPDVNMSLPPMQWPTFDVEFTPPKWRDGRKTANARMTVWHNGVKVHEDVEVPKHTPGGMPERPGPRPIWLQEHFHQVPYRNIWLVPLIADRDQPDDDSKE